MSESSGVAKSPSRVIDRSGKVYGRLTAIELAEKKGRDITWRCLCACGKVVVVRAGCLQSGRTKSCGCLRVDTCAENARKQITHGMSGTSIYRIWQLMRERCRNEKNDNFPNYGGRGVSVCAEWDASFEAFLRDVGERPSPRHTLDRIDVNGNYEPKNVRWATQKQQANNTTRNVVIEYMGERMTAAQAAERYGFAPETLRQRLQRGYSVERALTKPLDGRGSYKRPAPERSSQRVTNK